MILEKNIEILKKLKIKKEVVRLFAIMLIISSVLTASVNIIGDNGISFQGGKSVPLEINYQGYLIENDSIPVCDTLNMEFKLYTSSSGGSHMWSETHNNVIIDNGIFNVILGSNTSLSPSYFTGNALWLETKIGSIILSPRKKIVTVSYAVRSLYSDTANYAFNAPASPDNDWIISGNVLAPVFDYAISMRQSNILNGSNDSTHVCLGVGSTTGFAGNNDKYCTVSGGLLNLSQAYCATIGGGNDNSVTGQISVISGGGSNYIAGDMSNINGGHTNQIPGLFSVIGGGEQNLIIGTYSDIGGGKNNVIENDSSVISGGVFNMIMMPATMFGPSNINGGSNNMILDGYSTVAGGTYVHLLAPNTFGWGYGTAPDPVLVQNPNTIVFGDGTHSPYNFGINNENPMFPLHIGTNPTNGNGAFLTIGGVWTNGCSRTFKENFLKPAPSEILIKVRELNVYRYNYKGEEECVTHISPVAEDFYEKFRTGSDNRYLAGMDVGGVALLAIQELANQDDKIFSRLDMMREENSELTVRCNRLENEIEILREEIESIKEYLNN